MTAPTPPAGEGVPVVDAVVRYDRENEEWVPDEVYDDVRNGDIPAIAVPDVIWRDAGFAEAVLRRYHVGRNGMSEELFAERLALGLDLMLDSLECVAAELRHRAGRSA